MYVSRNYLQGAPMVVYGSRIPRGNQDISRIPQLIFGPILHPK